MGFLTRLQRIGRPLDGATLRNRKSVLQIRNVTSLGEVTQKDLSSVFCYSGSFSDRTNVCQDSVSVVDGKQTVEKCWSTSPLRLFQEPFKKRGQQEEGIYLHHHHHCHAFFGKRTTNNDTTMRSPERSLLSECLTHLALAENRRFNMTSTFIRVSFSTSIHATTMQRGGSSSFLT